MQNSILDFNHWISLPWLREGTVFLTKHGSHAYGLNTPTSDLDIKGVAVPPVRYFTGFSDVFEQAQSTDPDCQIYDIRKFFKLAADCNPNIIEVLWTDQSDWLHVDKIFDNVIAYRQKFLSKKAKFTFSGYAISQLKRINTHHKWLKNPPQKKPERRDFGLPEHPSLPKEQLGAVEAMIQKKIDSWQLDLDGLPQSKINAVQQQLEKFLEDYYTAQYLPTQYEVAGKVLGLDNFVEIAKAEREYASAVKDWHQFQEWKRTRNATRAQLEKDFGYDTKHAMHLVRLLRMCEEILTKETVIVKRPDREELLGIRNGAWTYDELISWATTMDAKMNDLYQTSTLRKSVDIVVLDNLCQNVVEKAHAR